MITKIEVIGVDGDVTTFTVGDRCFSPPVRIMKIEQQLSSNSFCSYLIEIEDKSIIKINGQNIVLIREWYE